MIDRNDTNVADTLDQVGAQYRAAAPRPDADLVARVLADAAAAMPQTAHSVRDTAQARSLPRWLAPLDGVLSWANGAVAAMALALALGIGAGMEADLSGMPLVGETAVADDLAVFGVPFDEEVL